MKTRSARILNVISRAVDGNDVLALVGVCMLFAGLWEVYAPLAPITVGALLVRIAVWGR